MNNVVRLPLLDHDGLSIFVRQTPANNHQNGKKQNDDKLRYENFVTLNFFLKKPDVLHGSFTGGVYFLKLRIYPH